MPQDNRPTISFALRPPQRSAGAVLFTCQEVRCILVRSRSGEWGFPKGHIEPGETEKQAALREILEETGAHARLLDGFCEEIAYSLPGERGEWKIATYFAAVCEEADFTPREADVTEARAFPVEEALSRLAHEALQQVLRHAFTQVIRFHAENEVTHG